jgi:adenylate kinase family enzyme
MAELIVVHGTPGSGKSLHSDRACEAQLVERQVFHISAGDRLRAIGNGSVGSQFKAQIDAQKSALLESAPLKHEVVNAVIFEYISQCPTSSIVLVDGYPRFIQQLGLFASSIKDDRHKLLGCIKLDVSKNTCLARIDGRGSRRGEKNITTAFIDKRFSEYLTHTSAAIAMLSRFAPVKPVDAELNVDSVWISFRQAFLELV